MTLPLWPVTVDLRPRSSGYTITLADNTLRNDGNKGASQSRNRFPISHQQIELAWNWTSQEYRDFQIFYKDTLKQGLKHFTCNVYTIGGYQPLTTRFMENYQPSPKGEVDWWAVSAKIEVQKTLPVVTTLTALPLWPADLPYHALVEGYAFEPHAPHQRTEMDEGTARMRTFYSNHTASLTCKWLLEDVDAVDFQTFYHATLSNGERYFEMPVYLIDYYVRGLVRFKKGYTATYRHHGKWEITAELELRNPEFQGSGVSWFLETYGADNAKNWHDVIHKVVNIDLNTERNPIPFMDEVLHELVNVELPTGNAV